jgi:primary-amine oxidase
MQNDSASSPVANAHPLDPLTRAEIETTVEVVRGQDELGAGLRFISVMLREPSKDSLRAWDEGGELPARVASAILFDRASGSTYEALVDAGAARLAELKQVEGVQPAIMVEEYEECERLLKEHPDFHAAIARRGLDVEESLELVTIDPVPAGNYGIPEEEGRRLARAQVWIRPVPGGNSYARPLEGIIGLVDLGAGEVIRVDDFGVVPIPDEVGEFRAGHVGPTRDDIRALEITQPDGPSFTVDGNAVSWQGWRLHVGFTAREGLVLHRVGFEQDGRVRPILHRASYSEMVVPYGDPSPSRYIQGPFDFGENLVGTLANSLELGCDCLGEIHYFDAAVTNSTGAVVDMPNVICMHEEDVGLLWKHWDFRNGDTEVRRSRRLVVSSISTVGNYDYGFFWYFYQDGTIESEVKLTGIVSTGAFEPGKDPRHGTPLAEGLYAMHHQHFFNVRLDFDLDGERNSVYEVHTEPTPPGPENPYGNAFHVEQRLFEREGDAGGTVDQLAAKSWLVVNPEVKNATGRPVAYRLVPGHNVRSFAQPDSSRAKRAGFISKHVWVTRFDPDEMYAAGDYPNQHPGGAGLPAYVEADRKVDDEDIVLWYSFGSHHVVRLEDWPIMPVTKVGFELRPDGFFDRYPTLDVPPPAAHCEH